MLSVMFIYSIAYKFISYYIMLAPIMMLAALRSPCARPTRGHISFHLICFICSLCYVYTYVSIYIYICVYI